MLAAAGSRGAIQTTLLRAQLVKGPPSSDFLSYFSYKLASIHLSSIIH